MPKMTDSEMGLANALAGTTDQGRAEILASEKEASETKPSKSDNPVKEEMQRQEEQDVANAVFSKVRSAVSAAEEACRKDREANPDADPLKYVAEHLQNLIAVLEEMAADKDEFKQMAAEARKLRVY